MKKYILISMVCLSLPLQAAYYRWTDSNGNVHYSSSVPPSSSQLGHVELSKQGVKKKVVVSSVKNKQLKLLEIQQAKEKKAKKERIKREKLQEAEDNRLLYIFNNEEELTESYNAKLRLAQITIDLLKSRHKVQSEKLTTLEKRHEHTKLELQKQSLEQQINEVLDNLKVYQQAITENQVEKGKVQKNFRMTLKRFKRLTVSAKDITK